MSAHHSGSESYAWFDMLYAGAGRDAGAVPWARLEQCSWVADFLAANPGPGRAVVVGCGLGDDAEAVRQAGYRTTAFDVSPNAVQWCRERFPESDVDYRVADLFDLPQEMREAFDLVVEVRTIQSLAPGIRTAAVDAVGRLIAPDGVALVVALARPDGSVATGPPWPVSPTELSGFTRDGLQVEAARSEGGHFVYEVRRVSSSSA